MPPVNNERTVMAELREENARLAFQNAKLRAELASVRLALTRLVCWLGEVVGL